MQQKMEKPLPLTQNILRSKSVCVYTPTLLPKNSEEKSSVASSLCCQRECAAQETPSVFYGENVPQVYIPGGLSPEQHSSPVKNYTTWKEQWMASKSHATPFLLFSRFLHVVEFQPMYRKGHALSMSCKQRSSNASLHSKAHYWIWRSKHVGLCIKLTKASCKLKPLENFYGAAIWLHNAVCFRPDVIT